MRNFKNKRKKYLALTLSFSLVFIFSVMQGMEVKSDTDDVILNVTVNEVLQFSCDPASHNFANLTPGTPVQISGTPNSTTCTITTNSEDGYQLSTKFSTVATNTLVHSDGTTEIDDDAVGLSRWDPAVSGNAVTWSDGTTKGLGFCLFSGTDKSSTYWGTGTTYNDALNEYAAFPVSFQNIMTYGSYRSTATSAGITYKLDVPATQKSGTYSGTVTYQAIVTP